MQLRYRLRRAADIAFAVASPGTRLANAAILQYVFNPISSLKRSWTSQPQLVGSSGDALSHMSLDLQTSFAVAVFTPAVAGCLLLLSWLHYRSNQALAQWSVGFFLGAVGLALIGERGRIPDVWSIVAANALIAAAYGIMWKGVRTFEGRSSRPVFVYAGAVVWILACAIPAFYTTGNARGLLITAIGIAYSLIAAVELWRGEANS